MIHEPPWPANEESEQRKQNGQKAQKQLAFEAYSSEAPEWMATLTQEQLQYIYTAQQIALEEHKQACQLLQENQALLQDKATLSDFILKKGLATDAGEIEQILETAELSGSPLSDQNTSDGKTDPTIRDRQLQRNTTWQKLARSSEGDDPVSNGHISPPYTTHERIEQTHGQSPRSAHNGDLQDFRGDEDLARQAPHTGPRIEPCTACAHKDEETAKLRELLNRTARICGLDLDAIQRGERPKMISYQAFEKILQRFKLLRNSPWKPGERVTIDEVQFQLTHPQKVDADGFARINYESGARHTGMSDTTIKRTIQSILEQCSTFPLECKWDVPDFAADGRPIKALYAKASVPDLLTIAPTLTLDAKRKQGGDKYTHQCQHCLSLNIKVRKKVTSTIICLDCKHETILDETVTEQVQKVQRAQKQLAFGKIYHAGYREPGTLELIDQALADHPELVLIDIRYTPESKNSQWTKSAFFKRHGERYSWIQDLGNVNHKEPGNIRIANPEKGIAKLTEILAQHSVILLCGCPEYDNCHRKSVIELYVQKQLAFNPDFCPQVDNLQAIIKPFTPPASADAREASLADNRCLREAAELLLEVAGDAEVHIVMPPMYLSKYVEEKRKLELEDVLDHLCGGEARGALCRRTDGKARGYCWDTDNEDGWDMLKVSAQRLVAAGYQVILEESPAGRGGHLWILFEELVQAELVRAEVYRIAPDLAEVVEVWPSLTRGNRVRLPGGYYARYGSKVEQEVRAWCKLVSVADGESSRDGTEAAALLLAHQNPVSLVPAKATVIAAATAPSTEKKSAPVVETRRELTVEELAQQRPLPPVDAAWMKKCGPVAESTYWFAVTEGYSATWFNQHHTLEEIQPLERNGMALSPNGSERTASTAHWQKDGEQRYTDFSLHGQRADGRRDSGDVLEYASKVWQRPKSELLAETTQEIVKVARQNLEASASAGNLPPLWVAELLTPAGWRRYDKLAQVTQASQKTEGRQEESDNAGYDIDDSGDYVF